MTHTADGRWRRLAAGCLALVLLGLGAEAAAQESGDSSSSTASSASSESSSSSDTSSASSSDDGDDEAGGPLDEELDNYWSVDRDVEVIKDRLYTRKGKFSVGLLTGLMSSEPFFWYLPVGARFDYYFTNQWGLEIEGMYMGADGILRHHTDLTDFLQNEPNAAFNPDENTLDQFNWRAHALAVWHPLYGKLSFLQRKLSHFDLNLVAGFGAVSVQRPTALRDGSSTEIEPNFVFGGGAQFFITRSISLRLEGRGNVYPGALRVENPENGNQQIVSPSEDFQKLNFFQRLNFTADFVAGVSYMF